MDYKPININEVTITGRLTKDIELKRTGSGTAAVNNSVAVDRSYKDQGGNWQKETTFVTIQVYGLAAESLEKYAKKGMAVYVKGRLTEKKWNAQDGTPRSQWVVTADTVHTLEWLPKPETQQPEQSAPIKNDDIPF